MLFHLEMKIPCDRYLTGVQQSQALHMAYSMFQCCFENDVLGQCWHMYSDAEGKEKL